MFLSFSIENYKNFKDKQTLYFIAEKNREGNIKDNDKLETNTFLSNNENFFNTIAIYGQNGGGKSNLAKALFFVKDFITRPPLANMPDGLVANDIFLKSFKLNEDTVEKPSIFDMEFVIDNIQYHYTFAVDNKKVYFEELYQFNSETKKYAFLFKRDDNANVTFNRIKVFKKVVEEIKNNSKNYKLKNNSLFISLLGSIENDVGFRIYNFFKNKLLVFPSGTTNGFLTLNKISKNEIDNKDKIIDFLNSVDINVNNIKLKQIEGEIKNIDLLKNEITSQKGPVNKIFFERKNRQGNQISFDFDMEESDGTKKMFNLSGDIINVLENGLTVFFDELDSRLHTDLLKFIIEIFNNKEINKNNAQLIFTTHNTTILNNKFNLFRRDQVFIINRKMFDESEIYSFADFDGTTIQKNNSKEDFLIDGLLNGKPITRRWNLWQE